MAAGRPRSFDVEKAVDRALELFWRHGYEGTSLAMLTTAMGINAPSLFSAFGNKEGLFRKVLERYLSGPGAYLEEALKESTARETAEKVLMGSINLMTNPRHPGGSLLVQGAMAASPAGTPMRWELSRCRTDQEAALCKRFERAKREGELPSSTDAAVLARYIMTLVCGFAVQSAGGVNRAQLQKTVELALRCWPI